mgnify:CR=1 FL=1
MEEIIVTEENILEEVRIEYDSCPICLDEIIVPCKTQCGHTMCKNCIETWFKNKKDTCPLCRDIIDSYHENNEKVKVIKIEEIPSLSNEETERYMLFLRSIVGRLRFFKYACYGSLITNLYLYFKYSNTYYTMQEYKNIFEICNNTLHQDIIGSDTLNDEIYKDNGVLSYTLVVIGDHIKRCMIPDKYIAQCF